MKILELYFKNLLSFEEAQIDFKQINLIVGPNNSGKTNILRILEYASNQDIPLSSFRIPTWIRKNHQLESILGFKIELSEEESHVLFQLIFQNEIKQKIPLNLKQLQVFMRWPDMVNEEPLPNKLVLRFSNGMTVVGGSALKFFYTQLNDWDSVSNYTIERHIEGLQFPEIDSKSPFDDETFQDMLLSGNPINEILESDEFLIKRNVQADLSTKPDSKFDSDFFDFLKINKTSGKFITIWYFISKLFHNTLDIIKETRPTIEWLSESIHSWRDTHEPLYNQLRTDFTSLFPNTSFRLHKTKDPNKITLLISENGKEIPLENSASGYFAGLYLLFTIYGEKHHSIFFDEPETHFHPTKLLELVDKLKNLASEYDNQLTLITHSPMLLDFSMLQNELFKTIYLRKKNTTSYVYLQNEKTKHKIKPYHFDSRVFFEKACIIVEGPSDEYALKAISNSYDQILKKHSIALVNAGGKDQVEPYIQLLKTYGIRYVALVDHDYDGIKDEVIILEKELEDELEKLGWDRKIDNKGNKEKIRAEKAYQFLIKYLDNESNKQEFQKTDLWKAISKVIEIVS